jgi:hypothetical protein
LDWKNFRNACARTQPLDPSTARRAESEHRIGLPVAAIGSHFAFQFDGAKAPPNATFLPTVFFDFVCFILGFFLLAV